MNASSSYPRLVAIADNAYDPADRQAARRALDEIDQLRAERVSVDEIRIDMVHELHTVIYGNTWSPAEATCRRWRMLVAKVADLSARSKAGRPEI